MATTNDGGRSAASRLYFISAKRHRIGSGGGNGDGGEGGVKLLIERGETRGARIIIFSYED
jgi:hypothetical protein